jgi:hypothetical protein
MSRHHAFPHGPPAGQSAYGSASQWCAKPAFAHSRIASVSPSTFKPKTFYLREYLIVSKKKHVLRRAICR